ncbi:hypothetical protein EV193_109234 [Herbihabitans rhizosphaerae]|uniref:Uncharacterized protein n=1 Tax=Herbihabitans rhizosphaerae TaxID=1872711 RepID=A0A4Q7KGR1_9PSEU|nr:hypothetical protein [Herbihabitans rhizosphaerae]RZS34443.1 hypothetical protein EV193_109234 [Herbihabitans rhizosphaerae]
MPISFDTRGLDRVDETTWVDPRTGDGVTRFYFDLVPDLPQLLYDVPALRRALAIECADTGVGLIEADVVWLDTVPAVYQLLKLPLPNRPSGLAFLATFTVPRAECSAVLKFQAFEGEVSGTRESMVVAEVGMEGAFRPHPYAPDVEKLRWVSSDDQQWDARFPDHPLTRARAWARHAQATAMIDPRFAGLAPFQGFEPPAEPEPEPELTPEPATAPEPPPEPPVQVGETMKTALPGLPVGDVLALSHDDDRVTFWRMADPDLVYERLGVGGLARSPVAGNRFRDAALLTVESGGLFLSDRYTTDGKQTGTFTRLEPISEQDAYARVDDAALSRTFEWLGDRVLAATRREEFVAVESAGWNAPAEPYVLIMLRPHEGGWHSVLETAPVPVGAPIWRDAQPLPEGQTGQTLGSPASETTIKVAGHLTRFAVETWPVHPLRLALSFAPNPYAQQGT